MLRGLIASRQVSEEVVAYAGEKPIKIHADSIAALQCNRITAAVRAETHPEVSVSLLKCIVSKPDFRLFGSRL